jgi:hypothetical protein
MQLAVTINTKRLVNYNNGTIKTEKFNNNAENVIKKYSPLYEAPCTIFRKQLLDLPSQRCLFSDGPFPSNKRIFSFSSAKLQINSQQ